MRQRRAERLLAIAIPFVATARHQLWRLLRPITIGVRALVLRDDEILLVRGHGRRKWHLPGGGVKRGEPLSNTAQREVLEETGWTVEVDYLLGMYSNFNESKSDHIAIFVCRPLAQLPFALNIEIAEACFFALNDLPVCHSAVHRRLAEYREGGRGVVGAW